MKATTKAKFVWKLHILNSLSFHSRFRLAMTSFFRCRQINFGKNHFPSISRPRAKCLRLALETFSSVSRTRLQAGTLFKRLVPLRWEEISVPELIGKEVQFKMENCKNYALEFHELLWYFTISCSMLNEITLKRRFHSQNSQNHSCALSCSPGVFSSSSFLQLRSKISNLGLKNNKNISFCF